MKKADARNKGSTLVDLILVFLILGCLAAALTPLYIKYDAQVRAAADNYAIRVLNSATSVYSADDPSPNPFKTNGYSDNALMQILVDAGLISDRLVPKQKDTYFEWDFCEEKWVKKTSGTLTLKN